MWQVILYFVGAVLAIDALYLWYYRGKNTYLDNGRFQIFVSDNRPEIGFVVHSCSRKSHVIDWVFLSSRWCLYFLLLVVVGMIDGVVNMVIGRFVSGSPVKCIRDRTREKHEA